MMLRALLRTRLKALGAMWFAGIRRGKRPSAGRTVLIALLAAYLVGCFLFMFGGLFSSLCLPLQAAGLSWLYFALALLTAFALCFIGSVFTAQKQLFEAKDNDLLFAMPIPGSYILGSRMLMLLVLDYVFELLVLGPAGVVWTYRCGATAWGVLAFVLGFLFLPLLCLSFTCLFGWLLSVVTARVRNKSAVGTVLSLAFLGAYFYGFSHMNGYLTALIQNGAQVGASVRSAVYPAWAFGAAVTGGGVLPLLGFLGCCAAPFALVWAVLSRTLAAVATEKRGARRIRYREKAVRTRSAARALVWKDVRRFTCNSMVLMNTALGSFFLLAGAVAAVIFRSRAAALLAAVPSFSGQAGLLVCGLLCMMAATNTVSASSVSLEGKNVWIAQSIPVPAAVILRAKVRAHALLTEPAVAAAALSAGGVLLSLKAMSPVFFPLLLLAPLLTARFCAYLGVTMNLRFPRLDYENEVAVVKQGVSLLLTLMLSLLLVAAPALAYVFLLNGVVAPGLYALLFSALLLGGCAWMDRGLRRGGADRFEAL